MNSRDLQLFVHLSRTLSFARTSESCHVSASSLSRVIQRLEAELGSPLFERDTRQVRLTRAGEDFRVYAEDAVNQWFTIRETLAHRSGELSGELSIFCSVTASYSFLYDLLSAFREEHPNIEIKLHTGDTATTLDRISQEQEDVGIAAIPPNLPPNIAVQEITTTPLVFIAPKEKQHLAYAFIENGAVDWQKMPMILSETGLARQQVDSWFRQQKIRPVIYAQVAGNEAIVSMVSLGFGTGLVPRIVVENSPLADRIDILDVSPGLTPFSVGVCTLKRKLSSPLIRAFWQQAARSLEESSSGSKSI